MENVSGTLIKDAEDKRTALKDFESALESSKTVLELAAGNKVYFTMKTLRDKVRREMDTLDASCDKTILAAKGRK